MRQKITFNKGRVSGFGSAAFSYFDENGPFFGGAGIGFVQTFTYDRKKFLIGKLKLSYRKVSTIIGESLAAMRRRVNRGA